jgi:hypothetical protein
MLLNFVVRHGKSATTNYGVFDLHQLPAKRATSACQGVSNTIGLCAGKAEVCFQAGKFPASRIDETSVSMKPIEPDVLVFYKCTNQNPL